MFLRIQLHMSSSAFVVCDLEILSKDVIACCDDMKALLSALFVFISHDFVVSNDFILAVLGLWSTVLDFYSEGQESHAYSFLAFPGWFIEMAVWMCLFHFFLCFSVIKGELAANGCISFLLLYSASLFYANGMLLGFLKMCFVVR